jgi:protein-disulfide isomerase
LTKYFRIAAWSAAASMLSLAMVAQTPAGPVPSAPGAAAPQKAPANPFPPVNPKFFTATSPTVDTVNEFMKQMWGFEPTRIWSVAAILQTNAPGVSKVVLFLADKSQPGKSQNTVFFTTPDGKHALTGDNVIDFGAMPFEGTRKLLQARADGPARGAAGKELLLVEFSDLQCPHCKDAQTIMDQLVTDFPQARVVFQNFPLVDIHPFAFQAAAEGLCVDKAKGDEAFSRYVQAVFDAQEGLTPERATATLDLAVTKAGGDPVAAAACAKTHPIIDAVNASVQLGKDAGVESTPMLFVNGQPVPVNAMAYEELKKMIAYRAGLDGVSVRVQPSMKTLK